MDCFQMIQAHSLSSPTYLRDCRSTSMTSARNTLTTNHVKVTTSKDGKTGGAEGINLCFVRRRMQANAWHSHPTGHHPGQNGMLLQSARHDPTISPSPCERAGNPWQSAAPLVCAIGAEEVRHAIEPPSHKTLSQRSWRCGTSEALNCATTFQIHATEAARLQAAMHLREHMENDMNP